MNFKEWLESHGADIEVIQEDDGSGYEVLSVEVTGIHSPAIITVQGG